MREGRGAGWMVHMLQDVKARGFEVEKYIYLCSVLYSTDTNYIASSFRLSLNSKKDDYTEMTELVTNKLPLPLPATINKQIHPIIPSTLPHEYGHYVFDFDF
jgi:hypothetical protein